MSKMENLKEYIQSIEDFYRINGVEIDPLPEITLDSSDQGYDNPFIKTGYYDPSANRIVLFIKDRHLKDVLRSFCHELIHRNQNLVSHEEFEMLDKEGSLEENPELEVLEGDAYYRGNLMFRKWTEVYTHQSS